MVNKEIGRRQFLKLGGITVLAGAVAVYTFNTFKLEDTEAKIKEIPLGAIITYQVASFANGLVRVLIDRDDEDLSLKKIRVINGSRSRIRVVILKARKIESEDLVLSERTKVKELPDDIRLTAVPQPDPEDDGPISMGDIVIQCRWPA